MILLRTGYSRPSRSGRDWKGGLMPALPFVSRAQATGYGADSATFRLFNGCGLLLLVAG